MTDAIDPPAAKKRRPKTYWHAAPCGMVLCGLEVVPGLKLARRWWEVTCRECRASPLFRDPRWTYGPKPVRDMAPGDLGLPEDWR